MSSLLQTLFRVLILLILSPISSGILAIPRDFRNHDGENVQRDMVLTADEIGHAEEFAGRLIPPKWSSRVLTKNERIHLLSRATEMKNRTNGWIVKRDRE